MSSDEMLSLFQETLHDVVGQLFKPDKVWYFDLLQIKSYSQICIFCRAVERLIFLIALIARLIILIAR